MSRRSLILAAAALAALARAAGAQQPAPPAPPERHVRGDVVAVSGSTVTVKTRDGQTAKLVLADDARVSTASKADLGSIGAHAFVGTTAVAQPDGTLRALEVHVFPESMRGAGEGHRPWDLAAGSTMTNATVAGVDAKGGAAPPSTMTNADVAKASPAAGGLKLVLAYPQGEQTVVVPAGTPVVKLQASDRSRLAPGAHVFAAGPAGADGTVTAKRVVVGEGGVVPPM